VKSYYTGKQHDIPMNKQILHTYMMKTIVTSYALRMHRISLW